MKKIIYLLVMIMFMNCTTDTDILPPPNNILPNAGGDYIGFVDFENRTTGGIHTGQVYVKVEDSLGVWYVTTTTPNYPLDSNGFGTGVEQVRDSNLIFSERDTSGIRTLLGVTYRDIIRTEEVQVGEDELIWSAVSNVFYTDTTGVVTEETTEGSGTLKKSKLNYYL